MVRLMEVLLGLLFVAGGLFFWFVIRKRLAATKLKQKHLAGLLLVSGSAFNDRNPELYAAAMREIANVMRSGRWGHTEIESRIQHALSIAQGTCSPDLFETANRLADNIIRITAQNHSPHRERRLIAR
jgi:hypothetical protein